MNMLGVRDAELKLAEKLSCSGQDMWEKMRR